MPDQQQRGPSAGPLLSRPAQAMPNRLDAARHATPSGARATLSSDEGLA